MASVMDSILRVGTKPPNVDSGGEPTVKKKKAVPVEEGSECHGGGMSQGVNI